MTRTELKKGYRTFLEGMRQNTAFTPGDVDEVMGLLDDPVKTRREIRRMSEELNKQFRINSTGEMPPRTRQAWKAMEKLLTEPEIVEPLKKGEGVWFVYGSMIFGDPKNNDGDWIIISLTDNLELKKLIGHGGWDKRFEKEWQGVGGEPHVNYLSVESLRKRVSDVETGKNEPEDSWDTDFDLSFTSIGLTGLAIFEARKGTTNKIKSEIIRMIKESDLMAALVSKMLKDTLNIRKQRRRG